jgi:hypothetical protein
MKLKILLICFPLFVFGQNDDVYFNELKLIESQIKFSDSISNIVKEEIQEIIEIPAHGRIDGKEEKSKKISIGILKLSDKTLRIRYRENDSQEYLSFYYLNSKLIYAESNKFGRNRNKIEKKKFYYEDEKLIFPTFWKSKREMIEEIEIFKKGRELIKSNH